MHADVTKLGGQGGFVAIEAGCIAMRGAVEDSGVRRHLVAACTARAVLRGVVVRRAIDASDGQRSDECDGQDSQLEEMPS